MLNIPEYKEYAGETKIALMDNSSLAFMHELSQRSYPSDGILSVYDLILIPKWVMEEIEDSTYRSTYVEQLQAQGYPIRWIDETKYGAFVNDEDVNLYYIVEAAVSRVSELMRFLRRKVKTEDLIDLPSAEEWMNRLYDEWPIHAKAKKIDLILTKSISRFARNVVDCLTNIRLLRNLRPPVSVYFDKERLDSLDEKAEVFLTMLASFAQEESRSISTNIKWATRSRMKAGTQKISTTSLLGYDTDDDGEMVIITNEAEIVRTIYMSFDKGMHPAEIAEKLNALEIRTI